MALTASILLNGYVGCITQAPSSGGAGSPVGTDWTSWTTIPNWNELQGPSGFTCANGNGSCTYTDADGPLVNGYMAHWEQCRAECQSPSSGIGTFNQEPPQASYDFFSLSCGGYCRCYSATGLPQSSDDTGTDQANLARPLWHPSEMCSTKWNNDWCGFPLAFELDGHTYLNGGSYRSAIYCANPNGCTVPDDYVPSDPPNPEPPSGGDGGDSTGAICFTGDSLLTLKDGSSVKFSDVKVGQVVAGADRNGTISYSQVIFNPHPYNTGTHFFVEVATVNGKAVRMTPNHLLPLCNGGLVTARSLKEGDCVMTADGEEKVAKTTQNVEASGIYTAVTKNEFLVVDGVVASPFALAHGIAHSLFDREDVNEWCEENHHLVPAAKDEEVVDIVSRRRLTEGDATTACVELMKTLFENYKDEGVGWGTSGFGYKNFQTIRGGAKTSLPMRLSGFA